MSVKESQKIWTERKKKNQESNTDEEQLKAILETGSLTQEQLDLLKMSQQLKKQSTESNNSQSPARTPLHPNADQTENNENMEEGTKKREAETTGRTQSAENREKNP